VIPDLMLWRERESSKMKPFLYDKCSKTQIKELIEVKFEERNCIICSYMQFV